MADAAANQIASAELLFWISAGRTAAFTSSDENWARNLAPTWKYQACSISVVVEDESVPGALFSPLGCKVSCATHMEWAFPAAELFALPVMSLLDGGMGRGAEDPRNGWPHRRQHYARRDVILIKGRVYTFLRAPIGASPVRIAPVWWSVWTQYFCRCHDGTDLGCVIADGTPLCHSTDGFDGFIAQVHLLKWQSSMICPRHD